LTHLVLDASAGVELALRTPIGWQMEDRLPRGATVWVPEHHFVEVAAVLRRSEVDGRFSAPRIQVALGRLVAAPLNRVSVAPLLRAAWSLRHDLPVADALYVVVASHLGAVVTTTSAWLGRRGLHRDDHAVRPACESVPLWHHRQHEMRGSGGD